MEKLVKICWIVAFPRNLALIFYMNSEITRFTDTTRHEHRHHNASCAETVKESHFLQYTFTLIQF